NKLENRIVMMARSKGLFAGVALEGGVLRTEKDSNVEFYNDAIGLDGRTLLEDEQVELPPVAQHFMIVLDESVPPVSPETTPASSESESDVDLRFAEDENAQAVARSAPGEPAGKDSRGSVGRSYIDPDNPPSRAIANAPGSASGPQYGLGANAAPEAGTWVTPPTGSPQPNGDQSSGSGLGSRIAGKLVDAALDGAKDLAVDSIRNKPEVQGAKLAARVGGKLASAAKPDPSTPQPPKPALPEPEATIASNDGTWVTPDALDTPDAPGHQVAGLSPDSIPSIPRVPNPEFTGPPAPSEWPAEWLDAQILGGVCEPES
ncbi:MAG: YSC84-related protein, partial [Gammaproteobacteria bacterium]|nr:YSC84-related protein [Gammaproteobacteria bacterium]